MYLLRPVVVSGLVWSVSFLTNVLVIKYVIIIIIIQSTAVETLTGPKNLLLVRFFMSLTDTRRGLKYDGGRRPINICA